VDGQQDDSYKRDEEGGAPWIHEGPELEFRQVGSENQKTEKIGYEN
jgi:hypothetical protein